jgi:hypothetical protein
MSFGIPVRNGLSVGLLASTFLTSGSGRLVPRLTLNFLTGAPLDSRITFSRTTNATLVDSTGLVTYAPNNLVLYSEQFDNAYWTKSDTTVTANATTSPDGTSTADAVFETVTNSVHTVQRTTLTITAGTSTTLSMYVKANGRDNVDLRIQGSAGQAIGRFVLIGNGTFTTINSGVGVVTAASITPLSNGWYRISVTGVATAADTSVGAFLYLRDGTNTTYAGDPTKGVFIWGAQFEQVTYQTLPSTYVQTVASAYYGPRFDYDPVTLAPRGLLIEEQRVNLALYSEQFDNAGWFKSLVSATANATASPDGTTNADRITADGSSNPHDVRQTVTFTAAAHTVSVYAKKDTNNFVQLRFGAAAIAGGTGFANFDLNAGTVGTVGAGLSAASITPAGNGWYRCTITGTTAATSTVVGFYIVTSATAVSNEVNSLTTSVFLYGAQLERGAFATSVIPTATAQVTRAADLAVMTGANFSSWYNQSEGTIITQFVATTTGVTSTGGNDFPFVYDIDSAAAPTSGHTMILSAAYGPGWSTITQVLGVTQAGFLGSMTLGNTSVRKIAFAYRANDFAASANGGAVSTDTSGNLPTNDRMSIGSQNASSNVFTGYMQALTFYATRLTNAQLQALTS